MRMPDGGKSDDRDRLPNSGAPRAAPIGARLLVAEGKIERETKHAKVPVTRLICRKLLDRSDLPLNLAETEPDLSRSDGTLEGANA